MKLLLLATLAVSLQTANASELAIGYLNQDGSPVFEVNRINIDGGDFEKSYQYQQLKKTCEGETQKKVQAFVDSRFPGVFSVSTSFVKGFSGCRTYPETYICIESFGDFACSAEFTKNQNIETEQTVIKVKANQSAELMRELYTDPTVVSVETSQHNRTLSLGKARLTVTRVKAE